MTTPMDISMRLLKDDDFMRDYFYQVARESGIPEEEIDSAWEESRNWVQPIAEGTTGEYHPGSDQTHWKGHPQGLPWSSGRPTRIRYRAGIAEPGLERLVHHTDHDAGTFEGIPFNEGTYFTTGEPMEITMRLLKLFQE